MKPNEFYAGAVVQIKWADGLQTARLLKYTKGSVSNLWYWYTEHISGYEGPDRFMVDSPVAQSATLVKDPIDVLIEEVGK